MTYPTVWIIDKVLDLCRSLLGPKVINRTDSIAVLVGGWGLYVVTILLFLGMIILGARAGSFDLILYSIAVIPIGILLHWVAIKLLDTNERLIASTPTAIRSENVLNVVAVLLILVGVIGIPVALVLGIINAIGGNYSTLAVVGQAGVALYIGILALNPERVNVRQSTDATIGQEAIGVMTFVLKAFYKSVPLFFGIFIVVAGIMSFLFLIQSIADPQSAAFGMQEAVFWYLIASLSPVIGYFLFLLFYVAIDVVRSILTLGATDKSEFASMDAGGSSGSAPKAAAASPKPSSGGSSGSAETAPAKKPAPETSRDDPGDEATKVDR